MGEQPLAGGSGGTVITEVRGHYLGKKSIVDVGSYLTQAQAIRELEKMGKWQGVFTHTTLASQVEREKGFKFPRAKSMRR